MLIDSAEARVALRAIMSDDLPGRGLVNVLSVRGIADELDGKWLSKQEAVWDYMEKAARRHARHGYCLQLNDVDFLFAMPSGEPSVASSISMDVIKDVQHHFLGYSRGVRNYVRSIRSLEDCAVLPPAQTEEVGPAKQGLWATAPASTSESFGDRELTSRASAVPPSSTTRESGSSVAPSLCRSEPRLGLGAGISLVPVWSVVHRSVSSFRLERPRASETLDDRAQEDADLAAADRLGGRDGIGLLQRGTAVHLPVSLNTLLLQRSRLRWLALLSGHRELSRSRVLLEIEDVPPGVLESRLREVAAAMRPFFRVLLLEGSSGANRAAPVRLLGFDGTVLDIARGGLKGSDLHHAVRRGRNQAPVVVVHGVAAHEQAELEEWGASHLSINVSQNQRTQAAAGARHDATELTRVLGALQPAAINLD